MPEHRSPDWETYRMEYAEPHRDLEPLAQEIEVVAQTLAALQGHGALSGTCYSQEKMQAHRQAVRDTFEIPWTAISPRMERLLYAINAIHRPAALIAAGVFCGNTFIANAGAAVGPGACYRAEHLIGVEIKPAEAARAARNVAHLDPNGAAEIRAADAVAVVRDFPGTIDLLYLDADGGHKSVYLDILQAAYDKLQPGALVLAHNSVNCAARLSNYLAFVRDGLHFRISINTVLDPEGLEVSVR